MDERLHEELNRQPLQPCLTTVVWQRAYDPGYNHIVVVADVHANETASLLQTSPCVTHFQWVNPSAKIARNEVNMCSCDQELHAAYLTGAGSA